MDQVNAAPLLLVCALFGGCAGETDARLRVLEERSVALDVRVGVLESAVGVPAMVAPSADPLRGLEIRLQALEGGGSGGSAPMDLDVDVGTRRVTPSPTEQRALDCAYGALGGVVTAELTHDAAFDSWEADFRELGYAPDTRGGCDRIVASRVTVNGVNFDALTVVVLGPARGRWFHAGKDGKVMDGGTMPEAEVVAIEVASRP